MAVSEQLREQINEKLNELCQAQEAEEADGLMVLDMIEDCLYWAKWNEENSAEFDYYENFDYYGDNDYEPTFNTGEQVHAEVTA